jgi:HK97 family phage portal protein
MMKKPANKIGPVKAALIAWLGKSVNLTDAEFWSTWYSVMRKAGQNVNNESVLSLSAAWACTRLISECIATLPLHLYERTPTGRVKAVGHPLYNILHHSPSANCTPTTYWEANVASMLLRGNGFSEKKYIGNRVVALDFLDPNRLRRGNKNKGDPMAVQYLGDDGKLRDIPGKDLFHVAGFSLDGRWGLSTIQYGAAVFGSALAATESANSQFEKGLAPTVAYSIDKFLKEDQRKEFRAGLKEITGALQAGQSPLLEGGMTANNIGIPPRDAQLLESRSFSVEEVCRWFRVDPTMVGHGNKDSNWGTGLEQKLIAFLTFTLAPWVIRIEQAINRSLLSPFDRTRYFASFSLEGLLRADSAARAAFYSVMVNNGIFTRDEVRVLENMAPRGGNADVLTVQSAMTPLDSIGISNDSERARAALAAWLDHGETQERGNA